MPTRRASSHRTSTSSRRSRPLCNRASRHLRQLQPYTAPQTSGPDGNGVSADQTNADISENGLLYQELTEVAGARDAMVQTAINPKS